MPPRVFLQKRPQTIENKGSGCEKKRKERKRGRKRKEIKEIEEVKEGSSATFVRDNTRDDNTDRSGCQEEYCTGEAFVRTEC